MDLSKLVPEVAFDPAPELESGDVDPNPARLCPTCSTPLPADAGPRQIYHGRDCYPSSNAAGAAERAARARILERWGPPPDSGWRPPTAATAREWLASRQHANLQWRKSFTPKKGY